MTAAGKSLQMLIQEFFQRHLPVERSASPNTIMAYRDAMKLFLRHATRMAKRNADQLDFSSFDANAVRSFLEALSETAGSCPRTRNQRLAALKAFARYVASVAPEHLERCKTIREILPARTEHPEINYLEKDEVNLLIQALDAKTDRRDRALLLLLYNTGARVQEVVDLNVADFEDGPVPIIRLRGKGRKTRTCPLWSRTAAALRNWLAPRGNAKPDTPLFLNACRRRLSRSGIAHILRDIGKRANLDPKHSRSLSPHVLRHTTAMHLLTSGVDITTIAAWLGHSQLSTTHGYIEIDLRMKQAALTAGDGLLDVDRGSFPSPDLITWLENLGRSYAERDGGEPAPASPPRRHST